MTKLKTVEEVMEELKTWGWSTEGVKDAFTHDQFKQVQITISIDRANTLAVLREGMKAKEVETNGTVGEYEFQLEVVDFPDGTKKKKAPGFTTAYNQALDDILTLLQETLGSK